MHDAFARSEVPPPRRTQFAESIVRCVRRHLETQVPPAVETKRTPLMHVVVVPSVLDTDADPALALGVAQAVDHSAPVARGVDPQAKVAGFAGNDYRLLRNDTRVPWHRLALLVLL